MKRNKMILAAVVVPFFVSLFVSLNAFADVDSRASNITDKAYLQALVDCTNRGLNGQEDRFKKTLTVSSYSGPASMIELGPWSAFWNDRYLLPSGPTVFGYPTSEADGKIDCKDIVAMAPTVYDRLGHSAPESTRTTLDKVNWLTKYGGYKTSSGSSDSSQDTSSSYTTKCISFQATKMFSGNGAPAQHVIKGHSYCFEVDDNNNVAGLTFNANNEGFEQELTEVLVAGTNIYPDQPQFYYDDASGSLVPPKAQYNTDTAPRPALVKGVSYDQAKANVQNLVKGYILWAKESFGDPNSVSRDFTCREEYSTMYGPTFDSLCELDKSASQSYGGDGYHLALSENVTIIVDESTPEGGESHDSNASSPELTLDNKWKGVAYLTGYKGSSSDANAQESYAFSKVYISETERIQMYMLYFQSESLVNAQVTCSPTEDELRDEPQKIIKWYPDGQKTPKEGCFARGGNTSIQLHDVRPLAVSSGVVYGAVSSPSNYYYFGVDGEDTTNYNKLLTFFQGDLPALDEGAYDPSVWTDVDITNGDEVDEAAATEEEKESKIDPTCYDVAGESNWIACPIIDQGSTASTWMYEAIQSQLRIKTEIFDVGTSKDKGGTFQAWMPFRDIANLIFIAIFIVVILSQLTGYGIDNYGIKKILPKLIMGALLINLSYFICQICIDVANIVGGGIQGLFNTIISTISANGKNVRLGENTVPNLMTGGVAAILIAVIAAAFALGAGSAVIIPILLGVIGVFIAILFLLILLQIRQALAVILVVISPLAFAMYMLPNTQGLFKKWLKTFSAIILLYPLCSLVVYGAQMASTIIMMAANTSGHGTIALGLTSAIIGIAPVFLIPGLTKKSMAGISSISGQIQNRLSGAVRGATERSRPLRNWRDTDEQRRKTRDYRSAKRAYERNPSRQRDLNSLSNRERARLHRQLSTIHSYEDEEGKLSAAMASGMGGEDLAKMAATSFDGESHTFDASQFSTSIKQLYATGNEQQALEQISKMSENLGNMSASDIEKFKNICATQGGTLGKAYVKTLAKSMGSDGKGERISFNAAMTSGKMKDTFASMDNNAVAGMTKDDLEYLTTHYGAKNGEESSEILSGLFTDGQLATAAATHTSGKASANLQDLISQLSTEDKANARRAMSAQQWASANSATLNSLGFDANQNREFANQIIKSGDASLISSINGETQRKAIQEAQNGGPRIILSS